eukprot:508851-Prorocentrum_lima.AAC.1
MFRFTGEGADYFRSNLPVRKEVQYLDLAGNSLTGFTEVPLTRSYKYLGTFVADIPSIHLE